MKLLKIYDAKEYELICDLCKHHLSIPPITENNTYMGDKFLRKIIEHFKTNRKLSYGKQQSIIETQKELGYNPTAATDIPLIKTSSN